MGDAAVVGADGSVALQTRVPRGRLAALAVAFALGAAAIYVVAVRLGWGQRLDEALKAWWLPARVEAEPTAGRVARLLGAPLAVATLVASCVVVARRRRLDAVPAVLAIVLGGPAVALLLKGQVLTREVLVDGTFPLSNTLPSGHGAVVATAGAAAVWLAPSGRRALAVVAAGLFVAGGAVVILVAALHRPSDVAASILVVGAWSSAVLAVAGTVDGPRPAGSTTADEGRGHRAVAGALVAASVLFAAGLGVAVGAVADRRDADSTTLAVFAAGCCLVAGVALTMVAALAWAARGVGVCARPASPGEDQA